jgi:hypothetical protein
MEMNAYLASLYLRPSFKLSPLIAFSFMFKSNTPERNLNMASTALSYCNQLYPLFPQALLKPFIHEFHAGYTQIRERMSMAGVGPISTAHVHSTNAPVDTNTEKRVPTAD